MRDRVIIIITWIVRFLAGGLFIFSGFVKAIDPWGTLFKVDDYVALFPIEVWHNLKLTGVFTLCALEFVTGVFFVLGCFRRSWPFVGAAIMCFMLPLTLWIAINDPVADCGCFGDAYVISNWATFWKNVILSAFIVWLIIYNKVTFCIITPALQWLAVVISGVFIIVIEFFGYNYQPLIDFRPYPVGSELVDKEYENNNEPTYEFIYEKDGQEKAFTIDDELPDEESGWSFKERKEIESPVGYSENNNEKDLRIFDKEGEDDMTKEAIPDFGKELIVMIPDLKKVSPATTWKLNSLYEWSELNDVKMIGIVSGSPKEIEDWEDLSMAAYPVYTAEDTQIKEVVRGNPAVVYLVNGKIKWKSTLAAIDIDDFMSPETSEDADNFDIDNHRILLNCVFLYLILMAVLIILSFTPKVTNLIMGKLHTNLHHSKRDDMAPL